MTDLHPPRSLQLVADLHISLSSDRGDASAHLRTIGDELVIDVDHPSVMLHEARRHQLRLPDIRNLGLDHIPVRIRSGERDLGRVWITPGDRIRVRPTRAGVTTALSIALSDHRRGRVAVTGTALLAAAVVGGLLRRRHRSR